MNTPIALDARSFALAQEALKAEGRLRFQTDWAEEIKRLFVAKSVHTAERDVTFKRGTSTYHLRPVRVRNGYVRRCDYTRMLAERPDLYERHVRLAPPKHPHKIVFQGNGWKGKSSLWDRFRAVGWDEMNQKLGKIKADNVDAPLWWHAHRLLNLRDSTTELTASKLALRAELAALLIGMEEKTVARHDDGSIFTSLATPSRKVDLDYMIKSDELRPYVKLTPRAESIRWTFKTEKELALADTEGDEWAD